MSAVSRSETSADPSGRKAIPQGLVRSSVMVCEDVIFVPDVAQPGETTAPEAMSVTASDVVRVLVSRTFPVCVKSPVLAPVGYSPALCLIRSAKAAAPLRVRCTPSETKKSR